MRVNSLSWVRPWAGLGGSYTWAAWYEVCRNPWVSSKEPPGKHQKPFCITVPFPGWSFSSKLLENKWKNCREETKELLCPSPQSSGLCLFQSTVLWRISSKHFVKLLRDLGREPLQDRTGIILFYRWQCYYLLIHWGPGAQIAWSRRDIRRQLKPFLLSWAAPRGPQWTKCFSSADPI